MELEAQKAQLESKPNDNSSEAPNHSLKVEEGNGDASAVVTTLSTKAFPPPPNGGTLAWFQVLGSACLWMATM